MIAQRYIVRNVIQERDAAERYRRHVEQLQKMRSRLPRIEQTTQEYKEHMRILRMRSISLSGDQEEKMHQIVEQNRKILTQLFRVGSRKPSAYNVEMDEQTGAFRSHQSPVHANHIILRNMRRREEQAALDRENQALLDKLQRQKSMYGCRDMVRQHGEQAQIRARLQKMSPQKVRHFESLQKQRVATSASANHSKSMVASSVVKTSEARAQNLAPLTKNLAASLIQSPNNVVSKVDVDAAVQVFAKN